jgi:hypothetical protein
MPNAATIVQVVANEEPAAVSRRETGPATASRSSHAVDSSPNDSPVGQTESNAVGEAHVC